MIFSIQKKILRRPFFRGQDRIFNFLFKLNKLQNGILTVKPLTGNFKLACDTSTWIGAKIVYTGDYEPAIKKVFKQQIKKGDVVLDIGANIGFHSLYFAELVGNNGKVIAFEPVPYNFLSLKNNLYLNAHLSVQIHNIALSNKNETLSITANNKSTNPGAFNLFEQSGNVVIDCRIGDEILKNEPKIDFIKIDVEGYEAFVIEGLENTIERDKPKIIFEFDRNYHAKTKLPPSFIFEKLASLNYCFYLIKENDMIEITDLNINISGNYLGLQKIGNA